MELISSARASQAATSIAGNATTAPAASPVLEPVVSAGSSAGALAPVGNATSVPGVNVPDSIFGWGGYFEALAWLCFALAILWFVLWLIKRRGISFSGGSTPGMRIESRMALGPKKWVIITRYLDRRLILGVTEQNITLLSDMPVEALESSETQAKHDKAFADFLKREGQDPHERI